MSANTTLLSEIEAFLSETGMGPSYFGKVAAGNSELVPRLRGERPGKGRIYSDTEANVRAFMAEQRRKRREGAGHDAQPVSATAEPQEAGPHESRDGKGSHTLPSPRLAPSFNRGAA